MRCRSCGTVKRERLDFLADNPLYTKRFAYYVGRRCRQATIKDIAEELKLDWDTVKTLEKQYMRAQLDRAGTPGPQGDRHRRDLDPQGSYLPYRGERPDPPAADLVRRARIARRRAWRSSTTCWAKRRATRHPPGGDGHVEAVSQLDRANAPQAAILFDKFHIMRHLGEALDKVRKTEYARLQRQGATLHQGPEIHAALAPENLTWQRRKNAEAAAGGQQAPQHRLPAEGILRPALGLRARGLGAALLRELARAA